MFSSEQGEVNSESGSNLSEGQGKEERETITFEQQEYSR